MQWAFGVFSLKNRIYLLLQMKVWSARRLACENVRMIKDNNDKKEIMLTKVEKER